MTMHICLLIACNVYLVTSNVDNELMAMRALKLGAYLHIKKPVSLESMEFLWQYVLRERMRGGFLVGAPNHGIETTPIVHIEKKTLIILSNGAKIWIRKENTRKWMERFRRVAKMLRERYVRSGLQSCTRNSWRPLKNWEKEVCITYFPFAL